MTPRNPLDHALKTAVQPSPRPVQRKPAESRSSDRMRVKVAADRSGKFRMTLEGCELSSPVSTATGHVAPAPAGREACAPVEMKTVLLGPEPVTENPCKVVWPHAGAAPRRKIRPITVCNNILVSKVLSPAFVRPPSRLGVDSMDAFYSAEYRWRSRRRLKSERCKASRGTAARSAWFRDHAEIVA
jgi:hypothetical protein